jgi:hypothetical protein
MLAPPGKLTLVAIAEEPSALPDRPIGVFDRQWVKMRLATFDRGGVQLRDLAREDRERPAVDRDVVKGLTPGQMRVKVVDWLEKHGFPFADVYIGQGKPRAAAFIDDRAVACSPQLNPEAYADAQKNLRALLKRKSAKAKVKEPKFNIRRGKIE